MVDGVSSPAPGYAAVGIQPTESTPPAASQAPGAAAPAAAAAAPVATPAQPHGPTVVPDFSLGAAGAFVLDWRDPTTDQVLVQVPMRTAFAQFAGSGSADKVGKTLDTEA